VSFLLQVAAWFADPAHWQGTGGIPNRTLEHVEMSLAATATACAIALPVGLALGHWGRLGGLAINLSNVGRAIPSFAILVLALQIFGIGATPAFVALVLLAVPPVLTNAFVGMRDVDPELREAARGLGMRPWQVVLRVELPVAIPVVMAGVRTAGVQVVATATLAALVAWGGLGRFIVDGFGQRDFAQLFAGALMVALLAFAAEVVLAGLQRVLTPRGLRGASADRRGFDLAPGVARLEPAT
jgi:osmoprotectant transport system permease protein